jgi:hypothetical protein
LGLPITAPILLSQALQLLIEGIISHSLLAIEQSAKAV